MAEAELLCCANCFGDPHIHTVVADQSKISGHCGYCGALDAQLLPPRALRDLFELLVSLYPSDPEGRTIIEWLQEDWALFSTLDRSVGKELLADVLKDGEAPRRRCKAPPDDGIGVLERWETFRHQLMYVNRYFPGDQFDVRYLFDNLIAILEPGEVYYRARLQVADCPFLLEEMGAPPARVSTHGRANPAGIPYLYLASDPLTAVSEVRPHPGEMASIAMLRLNRSVKVVDLRSPRQLVSPFVLGEENLILQMRRDLLFLDAVSHELMRPIVPRSSVIDYVPTQYLCGLIQAAKFDGVIYRSSVGNGHNLALFQPEAADAITVEQREVMRVDVTLSAGHQ